MPDFARPKLWAPPGAAEEARRDEAELMQQIYEVEYTLAKFNTELAEIDPYLKMVKAKPEVEHGSPFKAGYYHVIRHQPGFVAYVTPLEWPDGSYREPGSWIFEHIAKEDLWNDRARREHRERNEKLQAARQREMDREALDRAAEYDDRYKHATNTQILIKDGIPK